MNLSRAIRRDHDDRRCRRLDDAELRDRDLIFGQHLEEKCLERLIRAIELVDQKYWGNATVGCECLEQRTAEEKSRREDVRTDSRAIHRAARLGETNLDHLPRIIP